MVDCCYTRRKEMIKRYLISDGKTSEIVYASNRKTLEETLKEGWKIVKELKQ